MEEGSRMDAISGGEMTKAELGSVSFQQCQVRKRCDCACTKFGHRIYIVKINRGAIIGKGNSPWSAYVRAYQFLTAESEVVNK
jgi:hypothetical protein